MRLVATKTEHRGGNTYVEEYTVVDVVKQEKTLRDEFAMAILVGDMASQSEESGFWDIDTFDRCAVRCYTMANAMLKAREQ